VVPAERAPADLVSRIERELAPLAGSFAVTVRLTDRIAPEPNGKIKLVKVL
jgi:hypothetical protein